MKVLCIDGSIRPCDFPGYPDVVEGYVYNTAGICTGRGMDGTEAECYYLEEFSRTLCWDVDRFVPLSDLDESEIERLYQLDPYLPEPCD